MNQNAEYIFGDIPELDSGSAVLTQNRIMNRTMNKRACNGAFIFDAAISLFECGIISQ
jgi:hypothetical protein